MKINITSCLVVLPKEKNTEPPKFFIYSYHRNARNIKYMVVNLKTLFLKKLRKFNVKLLYVILFFFFLQSHGLFGKPLLSTNCAFEKLPCHNLIGHQFGKF